VGKCILTGSMEQRYFKVDGSMEKKWDTVIPADLKRLCKWDMCPTGHERVNNIVAEYTFMDLLLMQLKFSICRFL
jgi:hypothetical protein